MNISFFVLLFLFGADISHSTVLTAEDVVDDPAGEVGNVAGMPFRRVKAAVFQLDLTGQTASTVFDSVEESPATKSAKKPKSHSSSSSSGGKSTSTGSSATTAAMKMLMVQQGGDCVLRRLTSSNSTTLQLVCAGISLTTTYFSERPNRRAGTGTTTEFVKQFPTLFASSPPNAAITCSLGGTSVLMVVTLTAAELVGTTPARRLEYTIEQSVSQREASSVAMDTVLPFDNNNNEQATMAWELGACSLFIDSVRADRVRAFVRGGGNFLG